MALDATKIRLNGATKIYIAPYSSSALESAPADTVALGTAWGDTWVEVGYTEGGGIINFETGHTEVNVEQVNAPILANINSQTGTISFVIAETTLANLKNVMGHGTITTGAAATEDTIGIGTTDVFPTYLTIGFEGHGIGSTAASTMYHRCIAWKVLPNAPVEINSGKSEVALFKFEGKLFHEDQAPAGAKLAQLAYQK
jgi:hypothetical protein